MIRYALCILVLASCRPQGSERQHLKEAPNHTQPPILEPVIEDEQRSSFERLVAQEIQPKPAPPQEPNPSNPKPDKSTQEALQRFSPFNATELEPFPRSVPSPPVKPKLKPEPEPPSPPGGRFAPPRKAKPKADTTLTALLPPATFFKAKLLGNLNVTHVAPLVFARIYDSHHRPIGLALGRATLHPALKKRALLRFERLILSNGTTLTGSLTAFDRDKSEGLLGQLERRSFKQILYAMGDAVLAALSLNVNTNGDSFGNLFKFNLSKSLMNQARDRLRDLDLAHALHFPRDMVFWVSSTTEISVNPKTYTPHPLATHFDDAFHTTLKSETYGKARQAELEAAYAKLKAQLGTL